MVAQSGFGNFFQAFVAEGINCPVGNRDIFRLAEFFVGQHLFFPSFVLLLQRRLLGFKRSLNKHGTGGNQLFGVFLGAFKFFQDRRNLRHNLGIDLITVRGLYIRIVRLGRFIFFRFGVGRRGFIRFSLYIRFRFCRFRCRFIHRRKPQSFFSGVFVNFCFAVCRGVRHIICRCHRLFPLLFHKLNWG